MTGYGSGLATGFWFSACLGAGGLLYLGLSDALPLAGEVTAAAAPQIDLQEVEPVSYQPPPLRAFDEIAARPLFASDRRPYVPPARETKAEATAEVGKIEPPAAELVGIMLTEAERSALFELTDQKRLVWIHEGQAIDGWQVEDVAPGSATIRRGDLETRLELRAD